MWRSRADETGKLVRISFSKYVPGRTRQDRPGGCLTVCKTAATPRPATFRYARANGIQRQHQQVAAHARLPQHAFGAAAARIAPRTDVRQRVVGRAEADRVVATTPSSRRWATASSPRFGHLVRWPVPGLPDWPPAIEPQCGARQQDLSVADPRVARCSTLLMRFRHHVGTSWAFAGHHEARF